MTHPKNHTVSLLTMRPIQNVNKSSKTLHTPHSCASLPSLLVLSVEMAPYPDALHWIANPSRGCKVPFVPWANGWNPTHLALPPQKKDG